MTSLFNPTVTRQPPARVAVAATSTPTPTRGPGGRGRGRGRGEEESHVGLRLARRRGDVWRTHSVERPACARRKFPGSWARTLERAVEGWELEREEWGARSLPESMAVLARLFLHQSPLCLWFCKSNVISILLRPCLDFFWILIL